MNFAHLLIIFTLFIVVTEQAYTITKILPPGVFRGRVSSQSKRDETNSNGNTFTHSTQINTGGGDTTESVTWTFTEGTGSGGSFATYEYDNAASCTYTLTWRYRGQGVLHVVNYCITPDCYYQVYDCVQLETTYNVVCYQLLQECGTLITRDPDTGEWIENKQALSMRAINNAQKELQKRKIKRDTKRDTKRDSSDDEQLCGPPGADCNETVAFSPNDIQYQLDSNSVDIPTRLFNISNFGLQEFATTIPMMATIQAQFSLTRNAVCFCELGFAVNHVVDEASVIQLTLDIPYDIQPVSIVYTKILPASESQDIALAFRCTPDPATADVMFNGSPTISVTLVPLYP